MGRAGNHNRSGLPGRPAWAFALAQDRASSARPPAPLFTCPDCVRNVIRERHAGFGRIRYRAQFHEPVGWFRVVPAEPGEAGAGLQSVHHPGPSDPR
jgi:hypothetical protein